jgi:hypothetical protein
VTLTSRVGGTIVTVTLADGRTTTRMVAEADVVEALEPLLLVPEGPPPLPPPAPLTMRVESPAPVVIVVEHDTGVQSAPGPKPATATTRVEGSLAVTARTGGAQSAGAGVGAGIVLDMNAWLFGLNGRVERYDGAQAGAHVGTQVLSLTAVAGRRVRAGFASVDFFGGAGIASVFATEPNAPQRLRPDAQTDAWAGTVNVPQLVLGTRLTLGARSLVRVFVGLDGEMRPGTPDGETAWSIGGSLGLTVGS